MRSIGTSWSESLRGVFEIGIAVATPFLRGRRQRWGVTDEEIAKSYPGDKLVPEPKWKADHAISIHAKPEKIWPWLVQLGQGRGGFYSYQKLENLVGCKIENTSRIVETHQRIREGAPIKLHVDVPPMTVAILEEPTIFVLYGGPSGSGGSAVLSTSWAFVVVEQTDGTSKLISRTRYHHRDDFRSRLMGGPLLIEPISFVMERKMLKVIKSLVESSLR